MTALSSLRNTLRLFARTSGLIFSTAPTLTTTLLLGTVVQALSPIARLWVAKLIIDGLIEALRDGSRDMSGLVPLLVLEFVLVTGGAIAQPAVQAVQVGLAALLRTHLGGAVMRVANRLDYAVLEEPAFHDRVQRAQLDAAYRPINLVMQVSLALTGLWALSLRSAYSRD
jgi:ATP-binding cassette, subfamily B, bacterial